MSLSTVLSCWSLNVHGLCPCLAESVPFVLASHVKWEEPTCGRILGPGPTRGGAGLAELFPCVGISLLQCRQCTKSPPPMCHLFPQKEKNRTHLPAPRNTVRFLLVRLRPSPTPTRLLLPHLRTGTSPLPGRTRHPGSREAGFTLWTGFLRNSQQGEEGRRGAGAWTRPLSLLCVSWWYSLKVFFFLEDVSVSMKA